MAKLSEKPEDRRLAKTREALCWALHGLMGRVDWPAISISAICEEANVARSSFYEHFETKSDLLDFLIAQSFSNLPPQATKGDPFQLLDWLVQHVVENRKLFEQIVAAGDGQIALRRFRQALTTRLKADLRKHNPSVTDLQVHYILSGTIEIIKFWARGWRLKELTQLRDSAKRMAVAVLAS